MKTHDLDAKACPEFQPLCGAKGFVVFSDKASQTTCEKCLNLQQKREVSK